MFLPKPATTYNSAGTHMLSAKSIFAGAGNHLQQVRLQKSDLPKGVATVRNHVQLIRAEKLAHESVFVQPARHLRYFLAQNGDRQMCVRRGPQPLPQG